MTVQIGSAENRKSQDEQVLVQGLSHVLDQGGPRVQITGMKGWACLRRVYRALSQPVLSRDS
jgi:hypothetical protein